MSDSKHEHDTGLGIDAELQDQQLDQIVGGVIQTSVLTRPGTGTGGGTSTTSTTTTKSSSITDLFVTPSVAGAIPIPYPKL